MALPLLKLRPALLRKPWGGDALWRLLGKGGPDDADVGESWEVSDRAEGPSIVAEGPLAGAGLRELAEKYPRELLGRNFRGGRPFPLLCKFICARERLSVQVHPGPGSQAGKAKTEAWYVADATPGAELILGVRVSGRSRAEVLELLPSPGCEKVLRRWPAHRGDVFFVPAGTVHAVGGGLLLYEIQQNSDTTFRLYDWGRVGADGKSRPLHLAEAAAAADLEEREGYKLRPLSIPHATFTEDFLAAGPHFALVKWHRFRGACRIATGGKFRAISLLEGEMTLGAEGTETVQMKKGDTVLIPARDALSLEATGAEALVAFVPDLEAEIRAPLRAAGYEESAIAALSGPPDIKP